MNSRVLYTFVVAIFLFIVNSICFGEVYKTTKRPVSDGFMKKYGRSFFDMKNVNAYPIPFVLNRLDSGKKVETPLEWSREARPQILKFFADEIYGENPPRPDSMKFDMFESSKDAFDGIAERRQYKIITKAAAGEHIFHILMYLPKEAKNVPVFLYPDFCGNHSLSPDKEVLKVEVPALKGKDFPRGKRADKFPMREMVSRGYATVTFCYHELYNDQKGDEHKKNSVYKIFPDDGKFVKGGAISAWAWGNMRVMDLLETIPEVDKTKVAVVGHSRLGKTALLTGARDTRFAYVCVNNAGCMGDALSKRQYGESLGSMATINFPHWFSPNLKKYADNEGALPVDQHHLLAMVAPRMLYTTSASKDYWADPEGQLLGLINACPAFGLFGGKDFPTLAALEIENPFHGDVAYHIRKGKHNITSFDWDNFMAYAEKRGWKPVPPKK